MKMNFKIIKATFCCLFILFFGLQSFAQKQGNIWYFGTLAGIDFNSGSPVAIQGPITTNEGVATICDATTGSILFSTDGTNVYDKNNNPMSGGGTLAGNGSSTQSGIIVPMPGSPNKYYIFAVAAQAGSVNLIDSGLTYSTVDLSLNSGLGQVQNINTPLLTPTPEKVTAIKIPCTNDFWLVSHLWNSDSFFVYKITAAGISTPVISSVGSRHYNIANDAQNNESIGYLKASPNGKKIALAKWDIPNNNVEVFDFNLNTGQVTNPVFISTSGDAYGLSFSPDNSKLYVGFCQFSSIVTNSVIQYDLNAANVTASAFPLLPYTAGQCVGALQLAVDGKIYISIGGAVALDVITNPNNLGNACNYVSGAVPLMFGSSANFGLPNIIDGFISSNALNLGADTFICSTPILLNAGNGWNSYLWSDGSNSSTLSVSKAGTYWAKVTDSCFSYSDTIVVKSRLGNIDLGPDIFVCDSVSQVLAPLSINPNVSFLWSTGSNSTSIYVNSFGTYSLTVTDQFGCKATDAISIIQKDCYSVSAPSAFTPNGDGINDFFFLMGKNFTCNSLDVYDRWGVKLYSYVPNSKGWNGQYQNQPQPQGVYVYTATYTSHLGETKTLQGNVTLIR